MDLASLEPIVNVSGFDRVTAEWTLDPAFLTVGVLVFTVIAIVIAAVLWRHV